MKPTIDEYIRTFEPDIHDRLQTIRQLIQQHAPEATEAMNYGVPTFRLQGNLVHFAAFKKHIGFYPTPSGIAQFREQLANCNVAEGTIRFPHAEPIPYDLITEIVRFRVAEQLAK